MNIPTLAEIEQQRRNNRWMGCYLSRPLSIGDTIMLRGMEDRDVIESLLIRNEQDMDRAYDRLEMEAR